MNKMINMSMPEQETLLQPRIVVFGVGGAGSNAIGNMIRSGLEGVHFVAANTDAQALSANPASKKLQLGPTVTRGLGAGARPDLGREAAEEQMDEIIALLDSAHMVFITAGMGGGTGTGAAPVIARAARERGILTVGVVTKPFQFEGAVRMRSAEAGIEQLQQYVDTLIVIPNQNLFNIANEKTTWSEAFKLADDVLYQGVRGVTDLIMTPGQINLDFADIRSVMSEMGKAMMGTGEAEGENRARQAAEMAINNPLLDDASVKGARGVLINITGGPDLTLFEVEEAADRIRDEVDPDANIIFGTAMDENLTGKIRISVVATGIDSVSKRAPLTVVGGNEVQRAGQPQSAYMPAQGQMQSGAVAQAGAAGPLFSPGVPAAATGTTAQIQNQAVRAQSQAQPSVATLAQPSVAGNGMTNFYSGMTAEQVGNTLRAPAQEQPVMRAPAQATAPVRGTRQGDQFVAPAPVQAGRPAQQMQPSYQVPLQGLMPVDQTMAAQPTARKQGFGERMLGKVKKLVSQLDTEGQGAQPQAQMQQQLPQPRAGYEVSHGGRAGLPPVADEEIDIPSFLRRQAN
jgi:cell division protein FtsZ